MNLKYKMARIGTIYSFNEEFYMLEYDEHIQGIASNVTNRNETAFHFRYLKLNILIIALFLSLHYIRGLIKIG